MTAPQSDGPVTVEQLWQHRQTVTRYIAKQVRRGEVADVDDAVQTTFIRAWQGLPGFSGDQDTALAWLLAIARHVVCDQYRNGPARRRATEWTAGPDHPVWRTTRAADELDVAEQASSRVDLTRSIAALDAEQRRALALRVGEELPWAVVAKRMRCGKAKARRLVAEATVTP